MKNILLTVCLFSILVTACKTEKKSNVFDEVGKKSPVQESIVSDNLNGFTKLYYPNNTLKSEGHFSNGIKNGFWKYYFKNGKVKKEGNYANNIKDGFWKTYYKNGKVESEGHYSQDKPYGFWKHYNEDHTQITTENK